MVHTPLYNTQNGNLKNDSNIGLWYNKFYNKWDNNFNALQSKEKSKKDWIDNISAKSNNLKTDFGSGRIQKLSDKVVCYKTSEPIIIGMGLNHPIENGMLFHHTLGVPYLPGSSVKGLVRAWAEQWKGVDDVKLLRIFGSENRFNKEPNNTDTQAGSVIFFDALPITLSTNKMLLKPDIMTPHYPKYYGSQGKEPPADNQDPNPIPFLTVAEGVTFQFAFKDRRPTDKSDIKIVKDWLKEALENLGAGAKTAAGYGRMTFKDCPKQESQESLWVQKNVASVQNEHNIPNEEQAKKSKPLAEIWQKIEDECFKEKVKNYIVKNYNPSKKALCIYNS